MDRGKSIFISAISVLAIAFLGVLLYSFWPAITGTINGNKYYYASDLQESYDRGYDDGCKSETELTAKVDYYQSLVDEYYIEVQTLNNELSLLMGENSDYEKTILELTNLKIENETAINDLVSIKNENELFIQTLENEITNLEIELVNLKKSETNKTNEINTLQNQINNLQTLVDSLQKTNTLNLSTIDNLNNQVINLNSQISALNLKLQQNNSSVSDLNNKIADLEKTVAYYEEYIAGLENATQVVATFEFDGSVYNIQILNKGDIVSVTTPSSTDFVQFNYWMVNEQQVDLATYPVNENTKFVANVTYKNYYEFLVDGEMYDNGYTLSGSTLNLISVPVKDGFEFVGWSIDGVNVVDLNDYVITKNTTFNALFVQLHTVEFIVDGQVVSTQSVRNGEFAKNIEVENTDYITFNYWTVNGSRIDLSSYAISASTTFVADLTYSYDVIFKVDEDVYSTFVIKEGSFITLPNNPEKDKYFFMGWSIDGVTVIDLTNYEVTQNVVFLSVFVEPVLNNLTWAQIAEISEAGLASEYFSVGDEKKVVLSTGEEITFAIMGFNHDNLSSGSGKAGITFGMTHALNTTYTIHQRNGIYSWSDCYLRTNILNNLYSELPTELQNYIKPVLKSYTDAKTLSIKQSSDKLWLFSYFEVAGITIDNRYDHMTVAYEEGNQYEYWKTFKDASNPSNLKLKNSSGSDSVEWMTRSLHIYAYSPSSATNTVFNSFDINGNSTYTYSPASNRYSVVFGFCI